ncbi:Mitochondrial carrier domain [Phytophthora cactorum]|nr:Mitochondrial carrier domain [Phytophthora cactorum]
MADASIPKDVNVQAEQRARLVRRNSRVTVDQLLREAIARVDTDMDGKVNAIDIQRGLRVAGVKLSADDAGQLMKRLDPKNQGQLTYDDFHALHEAFILQTFRSFDKESKGYLVDEDLQNGLQALGVTVTLQEATSMIQELHPRDAHRVHEADFKYLYLLLRSKMASPTALEHFLWDPDVRQLSKNWWKASVEVGEGGLRVPLPADKDGQVKKVSPIIKFFGGALSGVIEALILTPLDVTKTRMQLDKTGQYRGMIDCGKKLFAAEGPKGLFKGFAPWTTHVVLKNGTRFYFNAIFRRMLSDKNGQVSGANEFIAGQDIVKGEIPKYRGPVHTAVTVVKHEGPFALWKGLAPTIGRQGLNQACSFWSNNFIKKHVWKLQDGDSLPAWKSGLTGMIGAIPGPCINCPMDVVKTRLMAQEAAAGAGGKYKGMVDAMVVISKEEGMSALYKGLVPRLARLCPSYGIQWLVMDQVTEYFSKN